MRYVLVTGQWFSHFQNLGSVSGPRPHPWPFRLICRRGRVPYPFQLATAALRFMHSLAE
ncbi:hypothetical protein B0H67DRAFT_574727 [Lasiosphaeris hirsuta]|uniref:Uncharacterized protein n=1 Tax=Lasiosphaeris hirsuta TaxID=260670 RepID=A0AA40AQ58_9PEZI|nr:hypothetical protein B0H67DRAFT_574727 [Lasiosphaeris hirsuta]